MTTYYLEEDLFHVFVELFYMRFVSGQAHRAPWPDEKAFYLCRAIATVDDRALADLFSMNWRAQTMAGYYVGVLRNPIFTDAVGALLQQSRGNRALNRACCFALAQLGGEGAAHYLRRYLDVCEQQHDPGQTPELALAALAHIDTTRGCTHYADLLAQKPVWQELSDAVAAERAALTQLAEHSLRLQQDAYQRSLVVQFGPIQPPPILKLPGAFVAALLKIQRFLIKAGYESGITGTSRLFPLLIQFARLWPYGCFGVTYFDWLRDLRRRTAQSVLVAFSQEG